MIQPVNSGDSLVREIERYEGAAPGLWWLGQSGFALKCGQRVLYLDPYLSESLTAKYKDTERPHIRMTACPLDPSRIAHADLVLCTHKHSDHLDPGTVPPLLAASPQAKVVLPRAHVGHAEKMGIASGRMIAAAAGERIDFGQVEIHPVPSAHESLDWSPETGYPHLGYVVRYRACAFYHPGDCVPYDGLAEALLPHRITVAMLPVNGRDPRRGVPGNFTIPEAAALASRIGARWLVPTHYDMFTFNTVEIREFLEYTRTVHPGQRVKVFDCGEGWSVPDQD